MGHGGRRTRAGSEGGRQGYSKLASEEPDSLRYSFSLRSVYLGPICIEEDIIEMFEMSKLLEKITTTYHVVRPAAGEEVQPVLDGDPEALLLLEHQDQLEGAHRVLVHGDVAHGVDSAVAAAAALVHVASHVAGVLDANDDGGAPDAVGLVLGELEDAVDGVAEGGAEQPLSEL